MTRHKGNIVNRANLRRVKAASEMEPKEYQDRLRVNCTFEPDCKCLVCENRRLQALVARLPTTRDGRPVTPSAA